MTLYRELTHAGHIHTFVVTRSRDGWEVREEEDATVLRRVRRDDWHRVERDALLFDATATSLKGAGWTEH